MLMDIRLIKVADIKIEVFDLWVRLEDAATSEAAMASETFKASEAIGGNMQWIPG